MATLELLFWAPVFVVFVIGVVAGGRVVSARTDARAASADAARAGSLYRGTTGLNAVIRQAARQSLHDNGITCQHLTTTMSGSTQPGATLRVTVACTVDLSHIAFRGLPGHVTLRSTAAVPIEKTRSR